MQRFTKLMLTVPGMVFASSAAVAHPAGTHEIGVPHVLTSVEHVATFLAIGIVAAIIVMSRNVYSVWIANGVLAAFLVAETVLHAQSAGLLFGLEVGMAGAALALGAWRATTLLSRRKTPQVRQKSR